MFEWKYITAAYAATWIVVLGYTIYLAVRQRNARRSLDAAHD